MTNESILAPFNIRPLCRMVKRLTVSERANCTDSTQRAVECTRVSNIPVWTSTIPLSSHFYTKKIYLLFSFTFFLYLKVTKNSKTKEKQKLSLSLLTSNFELGAPMIFTSILRYDEQRQSKQSGERRKRQLHLFNEKKNKQQRMKSHNGWRSGW